jgi:hypothetical protein
LCKSSANPNPWHGSCCSINKENELSQKTRDFALWVVVLSWPLAAADGKAVKPSHVRVENARSEAGVLWREPRDIGSRNLYYGPGGEKDQPRGPFTFVEEDMNGTNPKYIVLGRDKVKWTVKLGLEARPETVAARLVWAAGYFANEDYFLQDLQVQGMPAHLKRGAKQVGPDGTMHAVRLKRHLDDEKDLGNWSWSNGPYTGTRELNGLRVMMALINNWDLKNVNTAIYGMKDGSGQEYMVSDLGASFGTTGLSFPFSQSKGDLKSYVHSKFIGRERPDYVDFRIPSRPSLIYIFDLPDFVRRVHMEKVTHHVPRADAEWIGHILAGLSANQIRDAFRAAGYTQEEINAFAQVVESRIAELNRL